MGDFLKYNREEGGSSREKINVMVYYPQKIPLYYKYTVELLLCLVFDVFDAWQDHWQNACYKSFWWIIPKVLVYCFSQTSALLFGFRAVVHSRNLTINIFTDYFRRQRCKCFSPVCMLGSTKMFNFGNFLLIVKMLHYALLQVIFKSLVALIYFHTLQK